MRTWPVVTTAVWLAVAACGDDGGPGAAATSPTTGGAGGAGGAAGVSAGGTSASGTGGGAGTTGETAAPTTYTFRTVGTRSTLVGEITYEATLVAADRLGGEPGTSYLLVLPPKTPNGSVIIDMAPYTGIDWTGQAVDARHAEDVGPFGLYPDPDAPGSPPSTQKCAYGLVSAEQQITAEVVHLLNGHGVVVAFGRFYAGGSIADDAADAAAAFHYLASPAANGFTGSIGVYGSSWGGFMALQGAARRPKDQAIVAMSAEVPPTDLAALYRYWRDELPTVYPRPDELGFFEGYRRRMEATTGGPPEQAAPSFAAWTDASLCERLPANIRVATDDWDVLVPEKQVAGFLAACPQKATGLFWRRRAPLDYGAIGLDHGALSKEGGFPSVQTFSYLHLHRALAKAGAQVLAYYERASLLAFVRTVHDAAVDGKDTSYAKPAFDDLLAKEVVAYDLGTEQALAGADVLRDVVSEIWGRAVSVEELAKGVPAP